MTAGRDAQAPDGTPASAGRELPRPDPAWSQPIPAHPPPLHRLRYLLAGLLVMLGGSALAVHLYPATVLPNRVVAAYFSALRSGDAAEALSYATAPAGDTRYLTSAFLRAQQSAGAISAVDVGASHRIDSAAHVRVSYDVVSPVDTHGLTVSRRRVEDVVLHRYGRRWVLDQPAGSVRVVLVTGGARASLAGYPLPAATVDMFPGVVPVRFDDDLISANPLDSVVSLTARGQLVRVRPVVAARARSALSASLSAAMNRCLKLAARAAADCPLTPAVAMAVPRTLRGTVTAVSLTAATVSGSTGLITVAGQLSVRGSYQVLDFENIVSTRSGTLHIDVTADLYGRRRDVLRWAHR